GRASAAQAIITRQKIIDAAFDIALSEGFDKANPFAYIAKKAGVFQSGINAHFDRKADIAKELEPMFAKIINEHLSHESTAAFSKTWHTAINSEPNFVATIIAFGPIMPTEKGIKGPQSKIQGEEQEVLDCIHHCIGYAVCNIQSR
ncbi:TetR/AcrR family transcriptional regulator, partial [Vibrio splendidus]|uniref:TetR/AcrR family transcriptional regulator n=1 Tax=Vibrio splendidus TaxID=29497 RepID=UPI0039A550E1